MYGRRMEGSVGLGTVAESTFARLPQIVESDASGPFEFSCHSAMCSPCSCVLDLDSLKALAFSLEEARLGACPSFLLCFGVS